MLSNVGRPHQRYVIGLMSGTSLDGIDAVLLRVRGTGVGTRFRVLAYTEVPFPRGLKLLLLKNSVPETSRVDDVARLNFLLAQLYAEAVRKVCRKARVSLSRIDLIGSHGQTIQHLPDPQRMFGRTVRATLQIGDPSVLATLTGITTVGDFRVADMAMGGQGAPLVPYFDWLAFRSRLKNRILLNIGGIANITVLPKNCAPEDVVAFDTGPGNILVDALMQQLHRKPFDRDGAVALRGVVNPDLLRWLVRHPYLKRRPPKSTGREMFGEGFVDQIIRRSRGISKREVIATASHFTAHAVYDACQRFLPRRFAVDELIVSGGGARNRFFLRQLAVLFPETNVITVDTLGVPADAKEAICFAILANETMAGHAANMPRVTGAKRRAVLGKVCKQPRYGII